MRPPPEMINAYDRLLQEIKDYAIFLLDLDGNILSWNQGAVLIKGYGRDDIRGKHLSVLYTPEDRAAGKPHEVMRLALLNGRHEDESWRLRKDGSRFWASETITTVHDDAGEPIGFLKITRDLTERMRAEEAVRESEERYRSVVDGVKDYAIFLLDADGVIRTWNRGAGRITGFAPQEIVGSHSRAIFTPEDRARGAPEAELAGAAAEGRAEDERWHLRRDGGRFWGSGIMMARRDPDGRLLGFIKILRDHTERKHAEEEMRTLTETLEQRVNERTESLVTYQQQLRSLVSELGRTERRERQRIAGELHDHLAQILAVCLMKLSVVSDTFPRGRVPKALDDQRELLQQALTYTRTLMSDLSPTLLNDNDLAGAVAWVAERLRQHGLAVKVEDDGRPKPLDEDLLTVLFQSVRELLFNVVKHSGASEAVVRLSGDESEGVVRLEVVDRGAGFVAADRVFRPSGEGGFGLFNIRERLDLLGGRLEIRSAPGEGTTAVLVAPLKVGPVARGDGVGGGRRQAPAAGGGARPGGPKIRVLIADDHALIRDGVRSVIDDQPDMELVGEACDGEQAVRLAAELSPDVAVIDIDMPRMNGVEATRVIRAQQPSVQVVGLSVHEGPDAAAAMRLAGAAAYLTKGGTAETLCATIREVGTKR